MKTTDYSKFKLKEDNRKISEGLVKRLKESIEQFGFIEAKPILVNEDFEILDGQHRFRALKDLGLPIYYEKSPIGADPEKLMITLNSTQLIWRLNNYIEHFAAKKVPCYVEFIAFEKQFNFGPSNSILIVFLNGKATKIRKGDDIPLNPNRLEIANFIQRNKSISFSKSKSFVQAVTTLFEKANAKQIQKLESNLLTVTKQAGAKQYLKIFENLINYRVRDDSNMIVL